MDSLVATRHAGHWFLEGYMTIREERGLSLSTSAEPPEVTLTETARAALADLADLARQLPGDTSRNAPVADRLAEELAETGAMLRALPGRPAAMSGHHYAALAAFRTAVASGEDIGEFIAHTLARLAADFGGTVAVIANRPGSWEASLVAELLSGTVGPGDENLDMYRAES
jgi:hypothetical protein